jgi:hypothetical protein
MVSLTKTCLCLLSLISSAGLCAGQQETRLPLGSFSFQLGETERAAVRDLIKLTETH